MLRASIVPTCSAVEAHRVVNRSHARAGRLRQITAVRARMFAALCNGRASCGRKPLAEMA
jgi:hypothetical protein